MLIVAHQYNTLIERPRMLQVRRCPTRERPEPVLVTARAPGSLRTPDPGPPPLTTWYALDSPAPHAHHLLRYRHAAAHRHRLEVRAAQQQLGVGQHLAK